MRREVRNQRRRIITLALLVAVSMLIILVGRRSSVLQPIVNVALAPLTPVARLLNIGTAAVTGDNPVQPDYEELQQRLVEYESIIAEMQVELVRLRELERDYERLAGLVDYQVNNPNQNLVTADVIARDASGYLRRIIINRGTRDGIQVGNPVISSLGLVGRVEQATANTAWVRLAIDEQSAINARMQNSRAEGTIIGLLQGGLRMQFIPQEAMVEPGDIVVTSGLGGAFPPNIVIGRVTSVQKQQAALFQEADVSPLVDFGDLEIVSVITAFESVETEAFEGLEGEAEE